MKQMRRLERHLIPSQNWGFEFQVNHIAAEHETLIQRVFITSEGIFCCHCVEDANYFTVLLDLSFADQM